MSFSVNVRLGEVSATTSLSELSASVTISGGLLRSIPFSADKDTELEFADTITFSVDNPSPDVEYIWRFEIGQGANSKIGTQVKQDYASEGQFDVKVLGHYLDQQRLEGIGYEKDFVKVDFKFQAQLLNDVPGAAAAYSVRLLDQNYTDGLLRVRAVDSTGTDQGEADVKHDGVVLPDGSLTISLNSPIKKLDSIATGRGLSNSDTLGDLVDSGGANYDGFIPTWYDQSPNARHAANSTASEQPQIVSSGNLVTENGKPALDSRNRSSVLRTANSATWLNNTKHTFVSVTRFLTDSDFDAFCGTNANGRDEGLQVGKRDVSTLSLAHFSDDGDLSYSVDGTQDLFIAYGDYPGAEFFIDGVQQGTTGNPLTELSTSAAFTLFEGAGRTDIRHGGTIQEAIVYTDNDRSKQGTLKTNINGFYQIPNF